MTAAPGAPTATGPIAWLRVMRLSNAPTAASSALVGCVAGAGATPDSLKATLCVGGSMLLYAGGMVMNDYFDQPIDRVERPGRPIVSGQVSETAAMITGMVLLVAGTIALLATTPPVLPWALLLVSSILAYNLLHRSDIAGPALMACCRALVPTISAIACAPEGRPDWGLLAFFAMPLAMHTVAVSIAARHEAESVREVRATRMAIAAAIAGVAALAPLGALALGQVQPMPTSRLPVYLGAIGLAGWLLLRGLRAMVQPMGTPRGVMSWIAAIAAVDAASMLLLGSVPLAWVALGLAVITIALQRRITGS